MIRRLVYRYRCIMMNDARYTPTTSLFLQEPRTACCRCAVLYSVPRRLLQKLPRNLRRTSKSIKSIVFTGLRPTVKLHHSDRNMNFQLITSRPHHSPTLSSSLLMLYRRRTLPANASSGSSASSASISSSSSSSSSSSEDMSSSGSISSAS